MGQRRSPERTCVVCRLKTAPAALVRVSRGGEAVHCQLLIDAPQGSPGRGAYVCRRSECWAAEGIGRRIERALRKSLGRDGLAQIDEFARAFAADAA